MAHAQGCAEKSVFADKEGKKQAANGSGLVAWLKAGTQATRMRVLSTFPSPVGKKEPFVQIKISARHGHLSEATQQFIREKAEKLLHFFDRIMMIEVLVDLKEEDKHVEFLVSAEHKHDFVASERNQEILAAVDLVLEKLERQVLKYKEKLHDRRRTPSVGEVGGEKSSEQ